MTSEIWFVAKVLFLSTLISVMIKYGGQFLPIEANTNNALIAILLPALVMAILLAKRQV
jgi:hypothetical protein